MKGHAFVVQKRTATGVVAVISSQQKSDCIREFERLKHRPTPDIVELWWGELRVRNSVNLRDRPPMQLVPPIVESVNMPPQAALDDKPRKVKVIRRGR